MKVRVVLNNESASWIIGKIALRLVEELLRAGVDASLGEEPDDSADVNHWMNYVSVGRRSGRTSTMFITHIDDPYKTSHLRFLLKERVDVGLCMSRDMMRALVAWGLPAETLWYVLPAFDAPPQPSRIRIAIATRLYDDGRKRERLLVDLASARDLSAFHFEIGGSGWDHVVPLLQSAGATVNWQPGSSDYQADYAALLEAMRRCDYYLYLGMDEGSLGTLDALALGLKTIVTPQGFHLDIPGGITIPVETSQDLESIFRRLAEERASRIESVRSWTWRNYAEDHVLVWSALLAAPRALLASQVEGKGRFIAPGAPQPASGLARRSWSGYYRHSLSLGRLIDAVALTRLAEPLRRALRRLRSRGRSGAERQQ